MTKVVSELHEFHAANENHHDPVWMSDVPDDWSHTVIVTSDQPVMKGEWQDERNSAKDKMMLPEATKAA